MTPFILAPLIVLDGVLTAIAFFFPDFWFELFHGVMYFDPEGFLRRMGANWAAFALFQIVAWFRYKKQPHWLAVVAGMRLGDMFTDWTYLAFATDMTLIGKALLLAAGPLNVIAGVLLLREYRRLSSAKSPTLA